jgi:hypothetical protein
MLDRYGHRAMSGASGLPPRPVPGAVTGPGGGVVPLEPDAFDTPPRHVARAEAATKRPTPSRQVWLERLARLGYVARGVVYLLIGATAMLVAVGLAESARGSPGAIRLLLRLPLGRVLLAAVAAGLLSYALLSFAAATWAPEGGHAHRWRRWALRTADALTSAVYLGLGAGAVRLLAEPGYRAGPLGEYWGGVLLSLPLGGALMGVAGAMVVGAGAYLLYRAAAFPFDTPLELGTAHPLLGRTVLYLARVGTAARGILFAVCGGLALQAAVLDDPARVGDLGDGLTVLQAQPAGPWLLGLVGAGCIAYGLYQLAKARYRRIRLTRWPPVPTAGA